MSADFQPTADARYRAHGGRVVHVVKEATRIGRHTVWFAYCGENVYFDATSDLRAYPDCTTCQRRMKAHNGSAGRAPAATEKAGDARTRT